MAPKTAQLKGRRAPQHGRDGKAAFDGEVGAQTISPTTEGPAPPASTDRRPGAWSPIRKRRDAAPPSDARAAVNWRRASTNITGRPLGCAKQTIGKQGPGMKAGGCPCQGPAAPHVCSPSSMCPARTSMTVEAHPSAAGVMGNAWKPCPVLHANSRLRGCRPLLSQGLLEGWDGRPRCIHTKIFVPGS